MYTQERRSVVLGQLNSFLRKRIKYISKILLLASWVRKELEARQFCNYTAYLNYIYKRKGAGVYWFSGIYFPLQIYRRTIFKERLISTKSYRKLAKSLTYGKSKSTLCWMFCNKCFFHNNDLEGGVVNNLAIAQPRRTPLWLKYSELCTKLFFLLQH